MRCCDCVECSVASGGTECENCKYSMCGFITIIKIIMSRPGSQPFADELRRDESSGVEVEVSRSIRDAIM